MIDCELAKGQAPIFLKVGTVAAQPIVIPEVATLSTLEDIGTCQNRCPGVAPR
jgi:hypothetical protein